MFYHCGALNSLAYGYARVAEYNAGVYKVF